MRALQALFAITRNTVDVRAPLASASLRFIVLPILTTARHSIEGEGVAAGHDGALA